MRLVAVFLIFWCQQLHAEILQGVEPLDTLGDIKAKYPNAVFKAVKAAWVKEDEAFMSMEGPGFPGKLMIAFDDLRPMVRRWVTPEPGASASSVEALRQAGEGLVDMPDDKALTVKWVRWIPQSAIPFARYKSRYGEPTKCDYNEADMSPYCSWEHRGLNVNLSDDKSMVLNAEASFTTAELRAEYVKKKRPIPDWLKSDTSAPQPQAKKAAPKPPAPISKAVKPSV